MKDKGFTLLEVMVALIIVALAFSAFFSTIGSVHRNHKHIIEKSNAIWASENIAAQLELGIITYPPNKKTIRSDIKIGHYDFHYNITQFITADKNTIKHVVDIFNHDGGKVFTLTRFGNI